MGRSRQVWMQFQWRSEQTETRGKAKQEKTSCVWLWMQSNRQHALKSAFDVRCPLLTNNRRWHHQAQKEGALSTEQQIEALAEVNSAIFFTRALWSDLS